MPKNKNFDPTAPAVFHEADHIQYYPGPLKSPEEARAFRAMQAGHVGKVAVQGMENVASPLFGTDLDPNKRGNIFDQVAEAAKPQDPQNTEAYTEAEFGNWDVPQSISEGLAERVNNGVTANPDGTVELRINGQAHTVTQQGVPTDRQA